MGAMSTGNEQDVNAGEPCVIITDRESGLMPVIEDVFSKSYHMLCRRHIDQNVLAKLTEMIKDEEAASRHLTLKKIWVEIERTPEIIDDSINMCGHHLRKSHGLPCSCDLITRFEHVLPIQLENISVFWRTLEIRGDISCSQSQDMDSEMRDLVSLLDQISIGPISKVKEMRHLAKRVLNSVLPEDPDLSTPSTFPFINAFPGFMYPFIENWKNHLCDGICGYQVVADFVFGDEKQWPEVRR
ncbi:hypothetical protein M9H77_04016 [Catharanthus roseus]|uniref:Uncharacterized protein n=1 Tax=Catharanthus roseus TaxID=4058 RepID=A0ACC0CDA5_CATRO|nr:hypothetical protein M9H77_04016 [Catharanthus roseus]